MADVKPFSYEGILSKNASEARPRGAVRRGKYDFAVAYPDPASVPLDGLLESLGSALEEEGQDLAVYPHPQGYPPLREYVAQRLGERRDIHVSPDDVVLADGSSQPIHMVCEALLNPGDIVLTEDFVYSGTLGTLRRFQAEIRGVPCDEQGMEPDALESVIKRAVSEGRRPKFMYLIPTFQNPQGWEMPLERRQALVSLSQRYDVPILEDDCYVDLRYEGEPVTSMHALDGTGRVMYVASFSKIIAPGMRTGLPHRAARGARPGRDHQERRWCQPVRRVGSSTGTPAGSTAISKRSTAFSAPNATPWCRPWARTSGPRRLGATLPAACLCGSRWRRTPTWSASGTTYWTATTLATTPARCSPLTPRRGATAPGSASGTTRRRRYGRASQDSPRPSSKKASSNPRPPTRLPSRRGAPISQVASSPCTLRAGSEQLQEFLSRQAGVADQRPQQTSTQLPVSRDREPPPHRSYQYHVAALGAVPEKPYLGSRLDEIVTRYDRQAGHYAVTSTTVNSDEEGAGVACSRILAR